ncbi:MAG: TVP38/TMEM64 family protein [Gammaproteobacteria bacterium]
MSSRKNKWLFGGLLLGVIALALYYRDHFQLELIESWVTAAGIAAPLIFILVYALAAVLLLPGSVFTLAGGALFGPLWGTLYNLAGATLGATLAFLVARYLAADWAQAKSGKRLNQLIQGVEAEGWKFVAFVRLVPLFPYNLVNYAFGLTRIQLLHYSLATFVFMVPAVYAFTYLGYAGKEAISGGESVVQKALIAMALIATTAFLPRLIKRLRNNKKTISE